MMVSYETVMFMLELLAGLCAIVVCGPCLLACVRRLIIGDEILQKDGQKVREADVLGCDEPSCPYYKKNVKYLMVPARRRKFSSPTRQGS